jgi:acid phosphatase family membrane protein YuiD
MAEFWQDVLRNKMVWVTLLSWFVAQGSKIILGIIQKKRFNFSWILGTGGMPSSHSAATMAMATCMGKEFGFESPLFALSFMFAMVTMFDAQTWRRSIGFQAKVLNRIVDDLHDGKAIGDRPLRELVGHTPVEVFVGAVIGVLIPIVMYHKGIA